MADIFREIEEGVRRDRLAKLWKDYGVYIAGASAAVLIGSAAYILWSNYQREQRETASAEFSAASGKAQENPAAAAGDFAKLSEDAPSGYSDLALLRQAAYTALSDRAAALKLYDEFAQSHEDDPYLGGLARLKAAQLIADAAPMPDIRARLAPIMGDDSPWRYSARELMAYVAWRVGAFAEARGQFLTLAEDANTPTGIRTRAQRMMALIDQKLPPQAPAPEQPQPAPAAPAPSVN